MNHFQLPIKIELIVCVPCMIKKMFEQMRKELKIQGKSLTIFIEDITSFYGVDHALVDILVTEHTGTANFEHFCRLRSVVGITTA